MRMSIRGDFFLLQADIIVLWKAKSDRQREESGNSDNVVPPLCWRGSEVKAQGRQHRVRVWRLRATRGCLGGVSVRYIWTSPTYINFLGCDGSNENSKSDGWRTSYAGISRVEVSDDSEIWYLLMSREVEVVMRKIDSRYKATGK